MLDSYTRDPSALRSELDEFEEMLRSRRSLREQADILPLFRRCRHLAAALGYANSSIGRPDRLGTEHDLLGFRCDIAAGDSASNQFTLVELEDATERSLFVPGDRRRAFPRWSPRFEGGFSQLLDWGWRLDHERAPSATLEPIFGTIRPAVHFLLVIGRDHWLGETDVSRLEWRRRHNGFQGATTIWTYDYFATIVRRRITDAQMGTVSHPA